MNFLDADGLAGKDLTEVDFLGAQTDSAATGNHDSFVVEGVVDVGQSLIEAGGGLIDFGRILHTEGLVRALIIKDFDEFVEPGLLLQEVCTGRLGGFFFEGEMHAFAAAILLRMARLDAFDANPQARPPDGEFAQIK
jgi:hypothetical protein